METRDFLLEIGTEELPPKSMLSFLAHLKDGFEAELKANHIQFKEVTTYATPRRLAIMVSNMAGLQEDQKIERKGPSVKAAFNDKGDPSPAAQGFARSCGVDLADLDTVQSDKGDYLFFKSVQAGAAVELVLPKIVETVILALPIERRMKWGASEVEFVRPVHWVLMLLGEQQVEANLLGVPSGRITYGHRFMAPEPIELKHPGDYLTCLKKAKVIACFDERRQTIEQQLQFAGESVKAKVIIDEALLDEVTGLVEWPVVLTGGFDEGFLQVPEEALVSAMSKHQRYFHLLDAKDQLLPLFLTVSNIESLNPKKVILGNERVIRARLADAQFFYDQDCKAQFETWTGTLESLIFHNKLGNYKEKSQRISLLAAYLAKTGSKKDSPDIANAERAGLLCKADLVSSMVTEFPDLQGVMGGYYAVESGETSVVAEAIRDHYKPAYSGDSIPLTSVGRYVALADKIDTLTGLFGIGQPPSGSKDPFALRRTAAGVVRIILETGLSIDLNSALIRSAELYQSHNFDVAPVFDYVLDRFGYWYQEQGIKADVFKSVRDSHDSMTNLVRTDKKIKALDAFRSQMKTAQLIEVNKRVANILKGIDLSQNASIDVDLFDKAEETALFKETERRSQKVLNLASEDKFEQIFSTLAELQETIDSYFDEVMVMCEDKQLRDNRIATLANLRNLFLGVADLSLLQS